MAYSRVLLTPAGSALWRFKYAYQGAEKLISLGAYPDVSLAEARERRDDARKLVAKGIDPSAKRRAEKVAQADTVKALTGEYLAKQRHLAAGTLRRDRDRVEKFIVPDLGSRPIRSVTAPELLAPRRRLEARGVHETAHRTLEVCGRIWRYAVTTGRAEHDITHDLKGALAAAVVESHAALTDPKAIGALLRAIDSYQGQPAVMCALKLAPLVFVRPGELRRAEWNEIDFEAFEWRIPAAKMKMREAHIVPLAHQAVAVLREIEAHTGGGKYVFPSLRSGARPMSENAITASLRRMGYSGDEQTGHGFRVIASTLLNELNFHPDLIELQLAHKPTGVRAIYNRSSRLEERRRMMQAWADYLDGLRVGGKIIAIEQAG